MENASKALLIAGAVLIAILVATLGIYFSRNISEYAEKVYKQLEEHERTEFNQQFLNYDDEKNLTIQDIVTIINLAKDSNKKNDLENVDPPSDPNNDKSLYVTVIYTSSDKLGNLDPTNLKNLEKLSSEEINNLITNEMNNEIKEYKCSVKVNENTGYVNYIEIGI